MKESVTSKAMTVSNAIGDTYLQWKPGDIITIGAGTGAGKSHYIKNDLYEHAKLNNQKILMLIHRKNCADQFRYEIQKENKQDVITVMTYQTLENNPNISIDKFAYHVCDEFHYFLSDAAFNNKTDISFNKILYHQSSIKILMSATGNVTSKFIHKVKHLDTIDYKLPISYESIDKLTFYYKEDTVNYLLKKLSEQEGKTIIFIQSATRAYQLYKEYKNISLFNCGKSDKHYKYVDPQKIQSMLKEESFNEKFLFTTTCMDAGVNLKDLNLKNIICEVDDTNTLIQCIGRKRMITPEDKIQLYIKAISKNSLSAKCNQAIKKQEKAKYLLNHTLSEYINKYGRDKSTSDLIYDVVIEGEEDKSKKVVNDLMYHKYRMDALEAKIIKDYQYGYPEYMVSVLKQDKINIWEVTMNNINLETYLTSIVGKKLYKEDQVKLKEVFKENGLHARTLGINTLNGNLKDRELPFMIISKRTNKERYWEIVNNVDN